MLIHVGTKKINTNRLLLRRFCVLDAEEAFRNWTNDEEVTKYLTWNPHGSLDVTKTLLNQWVLDYETPNTYNWAIELRDTGDLIGSIGIVSIDEENSSCEIGYCLSKQYWKKGIMSEALTAVINYLFSEVNFNRIVAKHYIDNIASGKVMAKCKMTHEGILRQVRKGKNGEFISLAIYSILKDEYEKYYNGIVR